MDIYHYDSTTKVFTAAGSADPDPMQPDAFLHPAWSTTVAPPAAQTGFAAVFSGSSWSMVPDHRGETWWPTSQQYNTAPGIVIDQLGDPSAQGLTHVEPPAPPVVVAPIVATAWQMRKALNQLGLRAAVEAYVVAAGQDIKDAWEYAATFEQGNSMIETAATAIGKSSADVDAMFALAKSL